MYRTIISIISIIFDTSLYLNCAGKVSGERGFTVLDVVEVDSHLVVDAVGVLSRCRNQTQTSCHTVELSHMFLQLLLNDTESNVYKQCVFFQSIHFRWCVVAEQSF